MGSGIQFLLVECDADYGDANITGSARMTYIDPRSKLLQHIDQLASIKAGGHPAPVNVEIDLSNRCNLKCAGCHMAYTHDNALMDTGLALDIVCQLKDAGVKSITWSGGGEPTLHPHIIQIIESCELDQGIYTNGSDLSFELIDVLKKRMKWIYISLDRNTRDGFKDYKGADKFGRVVTAAQLLVKAKGDATIGVGFLLDGSNYEAIPDMTALGLHKIGADYVQFRPLVIPGADRSWVDGALELLKVPSGKVIADRDRFARYRDWNGHGYSSCYWAQVQTVITADGRVWACCNRRDFEGSALGDLNSEDFTDIWERSHAWEVDSDCRMMCRGHIPNLALNEMYKPQAHGNFI
jgi:MoaA/NifB/PqqE/SkfB family radical SAM enzyme